MAYHAPSFTLIPDQANACCHHTYIYRQRHTANKTEFTNVFLHTNMYICTYILSLLSLLLTLQSSHHIAVAGTRRSSRLRLIGSLTYAIARNPLRAVSTIYSQHMCGLRIVYYTSQPLASSALPTSRFRIYNFAHANPELLYSNALSTALYIHTRRDHFLRCSILFNRSFVESHLMQIKSK